MAEEWISAETERKEADFRGILQMHAIICKGIASRQQIPPYLYVDLFAGPGNLEYRGHQFDGSPLIARDVLTHIGLPHETVHYERDPTVAEHLAEALWVPTTLLDAPNADTAPIFPTKCQEGFPEWLAEHGTDPNRYGLVYSDPINDEIPHALLNEAAHDLPKVDLLSYVSGTQYKRRFGQDKRRNGENATRQRLDEHVRAVNKSTVMIRERFSEWHWTFVLWTNWANMPVWEQHGFHRLDSHRGQRILEELSYSKSELHDKYNQPLFGSDVLA